MRTKLGVWRWFAFEIAPRYRLHSTERCARNSLVPISLHYHRCRQLQARRKFQANNSITSFPFSSLTCQPNGENLSLIFINLSGWFGAITVQLSSENSKFAIWTVRPTDKQTHRQRVMVITRQPTHNVSAENYVEFQGIIFTDCRSVRSVVR